jgi:hypothetical protein
VVRDGKAVEVTGFYNDGHHDSSPRSK